MLKKDAEDLLLMASRKSSIFKKPVTLHIKHRYILILKQINGSMPVIVDKLLGDFIQAYGLDPHKPHPNEVAYVDSTSKEAITYLQHWQDMTGTDIDGEPTFPAGSPLNLISRGGKRRPGQRTWKLTGPHGSMTPPADIDDDETPGRKPDMGLPRL